MHQRFDLPNWRLGNYRLTQRLGRGGFAEVYLGEHIHLKTQVAVKVLLTQLTQETVETFRHEAQTIARLRHPSIVQVHDFGMQDGIAYLIMDYAPHGTLRQQQPRGTVFPLVTVVSYLKQVAEGLQYAHDQRLIHRDVKPENMLVGSRQEVLLSDFGIALTAHSSFSQHTQNVAGTILYMAPEQIQGHARPASDQYALGVVVYEWLCGNRPFQGTFTEIALQHTTKPPPSLRLFLPSLPVAIEQVVMTALQKDPQQRFPTVRAFAREFERACFQANATVAASQFHMASPFSAPPTAPAVPSLSLPQNTPSGLRYDPFSPSGQVLMPPSSSTPFSSVADPSQPSPAMVRRGQPFRRFSRRGAMIGIIGLVAAASSGLTWLVLSQRAPTQSTPTTTPVSSGGSPIGSPATLLPATASLVTYTGHTDDVVAVDWSPNTLSLATAAQDGTAQVWSADSGQRLFAYSSQVVPVPSNDDALALRWSRDSKRLVVGFADGTAQAVDVMNKKELFRYGNTSAQINSLAWSPDGNALALACGDGTVKVYEVASGKMITRFTGHLDSVAAVAWSHDGQRIASGSDDATVQVWSATTGHPLLLFKQYTRKVSSVAWSADDSRVVSCSWDNTAMIWDLPSNRALLAYTKHKAGWLNAVAWSPDGRWIASAGEVGTVTGNVYIGTRGTRDVNVHVWEAATGNTHAIYESLPVNALTWSPDGTRIATACSNGVSQVWRVP
ncbi:MAG TPA: serine/threonine-protein kinase [Ktedonosporobacter sp.]|nr:serine/threonine-protein kinase [Ktedonosporobacter sp.]